MFDLVLGQPDEATPISLSSSLPGLSAAPSLKIPADVKVSVHGDRRLVNVAVCELMWQALEYESHAVYMHIGPLSLHYWFYFDVGFGVESIALMLAHASL